MINPGTYIVNKLSSTFSTRVYPDYSPKGATASEPYCIYSFINSEPANTKSGDSKLDTIKVVISIVGSSYSTLATLSSTVRDILDYSTGAGSYANIQHVAFEGESYENEEGYEPGGIFVNNQTYQFRVKL
jgi:hypothetical protein